MIILYVLEGCPYCNKALKELNSSKLKYKSIIVENTQESKNYYKKQSGMLTFPQIFIQTDNNSFLKIGGYDDLSLLITTSKDIKKNNISIDTLYFMYKNLYSKN
jgi:glutaredoxin